MAAITPFRESRFLESFQGGQRHRASMDRANMSNAMMQREMADYDANAPVREQKRKSDIKAMEQEAQVNDLQIALAEIASFPEYDTPEQHQALLSRLPESMVDPEDADIEGIMASGGFNEWRKRNLAQGEQYLTQLSRNYGQQASGGKFGAPREAIDPKTGQSVYIQMDELGNIKQVEGYTPPINLSPTMLKALDTAQNEAISAGQQADKAQALVDTIMENKELFLAGKAQGWKENLKNVTGQRDIVSQLRTQVIGLKNTDAIQNLPPGVASDKDIELVMRGVPPDDAPPEELASFVRGVEKMERLKSQFNEFKANYISTSKTGDSRGLLRAWRDQSSTQENTDPLQLNAQPENDPLGLR